jgi:hypothetical protein
MTIGPALTLIILAVTTGAAAAVAGSGSPTLAPGETRIVHTGLVYRDIKLCNEAQSQGNLLAVIGGNEAILLAPGMCATQPGDSITPINESAGSVVLTYQASSCSDLRGH